MITNNIRKFSCHDKKNPTSVSTDGVLGRPNNWRSLDSRADISANAMPNLNANHPYQARKIAILDSSGDLPIDTQQKTLPSKTLGIIC